jgi:predicted GIY-YIG superfamily endonuclease
MYWLYVLQSEVDGKLYIGVTKDPEESLKIIKMLNISGG